MSAQQSEMNDFWTKQAQDPRSSEALLAAHRLELETDGEWDALWLLRYRGGPQEFELARQLTCSSDSQDRLIGANLLGQLGRPPTFVKESVAILIGLLEDPELDVIETAITNLGHRKDARAVEAMLPFANSDNADIRYALAIALGQMARDEATATLVAETLTALTDDADEDTRNWAMFGLGRESDGDSAAIRAALAAGTKDPNHEIRGEALVGLARRRDDRTRAALLLEWERDEVSVLSLEAAAILADPALFVRLTVLLSVLALEDDQDFKNHLLAAIAACQSCFDQQERPKP